MKLTEERLKELILEEFNKINENPEQDQQQNPQAQKPTGDKEETQNLMTLGDDMIETGRALKSSKVKGLDSSEIKLVSSILANVLDLASNKSSATLLSRLNDLIEKNK
tara:strand:- start:156 stop:479 length:324 start_codon:yes stop_codon:yes gene_type:complete